MNKKIFAPVVIFAYNRPKELQNLLSSLELNSELKKSKIIFFIDRNKSSIEKIDNEKVISIITDWSTGYDCEINISSDNLGLKSNILNGINKTFEDFEKAIFLEDDLQVSSSFLSYMNESLERYADNKNVKHISGYNYPDFNGNPNSSYFTPYMSCWGWGTWKDRWLENKNFSNNNISNRNKLTRLKFTVLGYEKDFENQLIRNSSNEINTWAIYWFQHIFLNKGLCLNPVQSLVINNGTEGVHGTSSKIYGSELNKSEINIFPDIFKVKFLYLTKIINFYRYKQKIKKTKII